MTEISKRTLVSERLGITLQHPPFNVRCTTTTHGVSRCPLTYSTHTQHEVRSERLHLLSYDLLLESRHLHVSQFVNKAFQQSPLLINSPTATLFMYVCIYVYI